MQTIFIVIASNGFSLVLALALRKWWPALYCRSVGLALILITLPIGFAAFSTLPWRMTLPVVSLGVLLWIYDPLRNVRSVRD
jgi:hypothetical protein